MAGLLDIFGTGGSQSMGLLGMSPEDIKRARDDAQAQALYSLAGRLFQGGNTGQSIAQGLQIGQQAYKEALQGQMQDKLQTAQLQDALLKRQEAQAAKLRQAQVQQLLGQAIRPGMAGQPAQMVEEDGRYMGETPAVAARPASFDIQSIAPQLMAIPEGRTELSNLMNIQKSMAGDTFSLAEGASQFQRNPFTGQISQVAQGLPKAEAMPTSLREFQAAQQNPAYGKFLETQKVNAAPKFAVNLSDPTAVAKAQSEVVKDWRGVVKDTGAMEVADRFQAAKTAVAQGNAGNKAADGALIYAIGKIYDPSGAVQEGDKATILGNRSIPDSIKAYAQKAFSGQDLLPSERNGLLSVAGKIVESKAKNLEAQKAPYTSISKQLGGGGELLLNPLSSVLSTNNAGGDLASQAAAELARRKKGQ